MMRQQHWGGTPPGRVLAAALALLVLSAVAVGRAAAAVDWWSDFEGGPGSGGWYEAVEADASAKATWTSAAAARTGEAGLSLVVTKVTASLFGAAMSVSRAWDAWPCALGRTSCGRICWVCVLCCVLCAGRAVHVVRDGHALASRR